MKKIQAVANPARNDGSFLCWDVPAEPYIDGRGMPTGGMQLPAGLGIGFQLPHGLAAKLVSVWNAWVDATQTLEGVRELEPERLIWCHPCKVWREAKNVRELKCPRCGSKIVLSADPKWGEYHRLPTTVSMLEAIDGRVARFFWPSASVERLRMLQALLSDGLVHNATYDGSVNSVEYFIWHPLLPLLDSNTVVPLINIAWQGNRLVFGNGTTVELNLGSYQPDWAKLQFEFPKVSFDVVWPDGRRER